MLVKTAFGYVAAVVGGLLAEGPPEGCRQCDDRERSRRRRRALAA